MRYYGDKKIAMYYGDGRPRTRYRNGQRIGGWKLSEKSGAALSWDGTYNDKFLALSVTGGTTQAAEYRQAGGVSTQDGIPTPDAPITITPCLAAGTYRLPNTTLDVTIPALHGIGDVRDRVVWDRLSGLCWLDGKLGKITFTGNETVRVPAATPVNGYPYRVNSGISSAAHPQIILCTKYKGITSVLAISDMKVNETKYYGGAGFFDFTSSAATINEFKVEIAGTVIIYQLATPTRTPLTITDNPDSTAPELPMEAISPAISEDYPYGVYNTGDNNLIPPVGDPIPVPILRGRGEYRDTYNVLTGELIRRIDPDIDNCTTQSIADVGGAYVLETPVLEQYTPVVIPTYPISTVIGQDGEVKGNIVATVKIVDDMGV